MTREQLKACLPYAKDENIDKFFGPINATIEKYQITDPKRLAAFLAQIAHESGSLRYVRELADGQDYEGRKDLGNIKPGDGPKFRGRGLIQITGRTNYTHLADAFKIDLLNKPEILEQPLYATLSAGWFWNERGLNGLADAENFLLISKRINGVNKKTGLPNGWDDRVKHWTTCKTALYAK
jgi:putative chitinase